MKVIHLCGLLAGLLVTEACSKESSKEKSLSPEELAKKNQLEKTKKAQEKKIRAIEISAEHKKSAIESSGKEALAYKLLDSIATNDLELYDEIYYIMGENFAEENDLVESTQ